MNKPNLMFEQGIIIPAGSGQGQGRIRGGRNLDGGVYFDIWFPGDHNPRRINIAPQEAFQLAAGVFKALGIEMQYGYDGPGSN